MSSVSINLAEWVPGDRPREFDPEEIIRWAVRRFADSNIVMTSSFGMEGVALLDMLARHLPELRVIYVDTAFLFPETLELRDRLRNRYPTVTFDRVEPRVTPEQQAAEFGAQLWTSDPDLCCKIRKVEPLHRIMQGVDVWFAALRRSQSETRKNLPIVDWNWDYEALKICPLATWSGEMVYRYVVTNDLPYNTLHDQSYPTVGCTHCTRPVKNARPWHYSRQGRWVGFEKNECGLNDGAGI